MSAADVEVVLDARAELGEGPRWDPGEQRLLWVDIMAGRVHAFRPDKGACRNVGVGKPVGALAGARDGSLVLAVADGFARLDFKSGATTMLAAVEADRPQNRMNDGACDPAGRFWAGTMALDESPGQGALYRLDPDLTVHTMVTGVTISNGIDWSPDGLTMYLADSGPGVVHAFDFDERGTIANERVFLALPEESGTPDGLTVDASGDVWVAIWGGGRVARYGADGTLREELPVPAVETTSCAFAGPGLHWLYVTTATEHWTDEQRRAAPGAGLLYRFETAATGRPAARFRPEPGWWARVRAER